MPQADSKMTLAIHAAGPDASVAVGRGPTLLHLEPVSNAARHDDDLMPAIARAFDRVGTVPTDLETVFVSVGPGGFTGLRIAVSTAKMLALALNCRVVAVPETRVVLAAAGSPPPVAICLAGKHGDYWTALPGTVPSDSNPSPDAQLLAVSDIVERARTLGITRIAINQPADCVRDLSEAATAAGMDVVEVRSDASHLWHVGRSMATAGCFAVPEQLFPIYPREPEAIRLWRDRRSRRDF